jgi:hypothetical protein
VRRLLAFLLALVIATAGAVGILLLLQSRDEGTIDRSVTTQMVTNGQTLP